MDRRLLDLGVDMRQLQGEARQRQQSQVEAWRQEASRLRENPGRGDGTRRQPGGLLGGGVSAAAITTSIFDSLPEPADDDLPGDLPGSYEMPSIGDQRGETSAQSGEPETLESADADSQPAPSGGEMIGEVSTHSLDHVTAVTTSQVRARIEVEAPHLPADLRDGLAARIVLALGTHAHGGHGTGDSHAHDEALEHWDETLQQGLSVTSATGLVRVSFRPTTAPAYGALTRLSPEDAKTVQGTSLITTTSYSDSVVQEKTIGVGGLLYLFTAPVRHAVFLSPQFTFVPRKQLIQESVRSTEAVGGSRLGDGPQSTYTSGTTAVITVLHRDRDPQTFSIDLPEHQVSYAVRTSIAPPPPVPGEAPWQATVASGSRLAKYPFALTRIDTEKVLTRIGQKLLHAGYPGQQAGKVLDMIAEKVINPELAKRFNQSLLDGTYRSGLVEVAHLLGNVRISLELTAMRREPNITGPDAVPLRTDFSDTLYTEENRSHGYDAPLLFEVLARVFGLNVGGGGFGFETSTMYEASVEEAHARKFAASFSGDLARYQVTLRAVVEFDTDSTWWVEPGRLLRFDNPIASVKPVEGFIVEEIPGEIVVPARHAAALQHDVTEAIPDLGTASDKIIELYARHAGQLAAPGMRPDDGVNFADRRPLTRVKPRPAVLTDAADGEQGLYTKGDITTTLPDVDLTRPDIVAQLSRTAHALLEQAAHGGVQVVVENPQLASGLRDWVQRVWPSAKGPGPARP